MLTSRLTIIVTNNKWRRMLNACEMLCNWPVQCVFIWLNCATNYCVSGVGHALICLSLFSHVTECRLLNRDYLYSWTERVELRYLKPICTCATGNLLLSYTTRVHRSTGSCNHLRPRQLATGQTTMRLIMQTEQQPKATTSDSPPPAPHSRPTCT